MSKMTELLNDLCPQGTNIVRVKMGEVLTFLNGRAYKQDELLLSGKYPVLRVGNFYTNDSWYYSNLELSEDKYCDKGDLLYSWAATLGPKIWDGGKCIFHYHIWKIVFDEMKIDKKYLFYYLQCDLNSIRNSTTSSTMVHVSMSSMKERMIEIPPIKVQLEIVRILDKFTKLEQSLCEELGARKSQYQYYLDKLLTFPETVPEYKLGDLCSFFNGDRGKNYPSNADYVTRGVPFINAGDIERGTVDLDGCNKVSLEKYNTMGGAKLKKNDIVYCLRGSIGKNGVYERDGGTVASSLVAIRSNDENRLNPKFLFYLLNSSFELKQRILKDNGAAQPNLAAQSVKEFVFRVPGIEAQKRIVNRLDAFWVMCTDIQKGLPAEIEARHKQYEYYRDKLLTFERKEV